VTFKNILESIVAEDGDIDLLKSAIFYFSSKPNIILKIKV